MSYDSQVPAQIWQTPRPWSRRPAAGPPRPALFLALLLFSFGGGWALLKYWPASAPKRASVETVAPTPVVIPMGEAEDMAHHLDEAIAETLKAVGEMKRSQDWAERLAPALEQNYLGMEKRRLQVSLDASESARRRLEKVREELETTNNLFIERSKARP